MRKLRVLALMHDYLVPPADVTGIDVTNAKWKMEFDVTHTLEHMGHEVRPLGLGGDLGVITEAVKDWKPHIVFNLMENFEGIAVFDQNVVSHLELLRMPYTGCNPRGLMLSRDKALSKTLLAYHRIPVPEFAVFRVGRAIQRPKRLKFPADRQVADAGVVDRHLAGLGRRRRRQAARARPLHPPQGRHRRHRRALHRGPRALCRRPRQPEAAGVSGVGAEVHQAARGSLAHRHRAREVERQLSEEVRHHERPGERSARGCARRNLQKICASASIARSI